MTNSNNNNLNSIAVAISLLISAIMLIISVTSMIAAKESRSEDLGNRIGRLEQWSEDMTKHVDRLEKKIDEMPSKINLSVSPQHPIRKITKPTNVSSPTTIAEGFTRDVFAGVIR